MKNVKFALACLLLLSSAAAYAGGTWTSKIVHFETVYKGSHAYELFTFAKSGADAPSCARHSRKVAIDLRTDEGKIAAVIVESTARSGDTLTVIGTGICDVIPDAETLRVVHEKGGDIFEGSAL
jgi:hypothetical protein